jgi:hypothetical protein
VLDAGTLDLGTVTARSHREANVKLLLSGEADNQRPKEIPEVTKKLSDPDTRKRHFECDNTER